jgi:serine/threonine protein kinase/tetratricopeptide (TPR) repeat protein
VTLESGVRVGKYVIGRKLGQGGFGVIHAARDTELDRDIAIKFLRPEHVFKPTVVQRFLQEARAAARINHPGIVTVHESGIVGGTNTRADGTVYIAMELLQGETLAQRLARVGRMPLGVSIGIAAQLATALSAAHACSIVHRDLKPQNVWLQPDRAVLGGERVKILDFGIAKLVDDFGSALQTHSMQMLGTPMYMSPEQCRSSAKVDARSDIYALGCMLFELVCGRPPFDGDSGELIAKHQLVAPPTARSLEASLPAALDRLVTSMLAKSPDDRPQTMDAVLDALHPLADSEDLPSITETKPLSRMPDLPSTTLTEGAASHDVPHRRARRGLYIGAAVALALGVGAGGLAMHGGGSDDAAAISSASGSATIAPPIQQLPAAPPPVADAATDQDIQLECRNAMVEKKWQDLASCAQRLGAIDQALAQQFAKQARAEHANEISATKLEDALKQGDLAQARRQLDKIDDDSVYKPNAREKYDGLVKQVVDDLSARASRLAAAHKCSDFDRLVSQAAAQGPDVADALRAQGCNVATGAGGCDADKLAEKGSQDEAIGQHAAALAQYEKAYKCKPSDRLLRLALMASCNAGDKAKARHYYQELATNPSRGTIAQMCVRAGIKIEQLDAPEPPPANCDANALAEKGQQDAAIGQHAAALAQYEKAYKCKPSDRLLRLAFMSACNAGLLATARRYYKLLSSNPSRGTIAQMCVRAGISIEQLETP